MTRLRTYRNARWIVMAVVAALLGLWVPGTTARAAGATIMVSGSPSRTAAVALAGTTRSGNLYIFTTPTAGVAKVSFWLDDPQRSGLPKQVEAYAPFDFRGGTDAAATAWNSTSVANGTHVLTVAVVDNAKVTTVVSASFTVSNGTAAGYAPQVSTSSNRSAPFPVAGAVLHGSVYVFVPSVVGITKVSFYLDDVARAHAPRHVENTGPWDFVSTGATNATALPWVTTGLPDGSHVLSVDVTAGTAVTHLNATFTVLNGTVATPTPTPTTPSPTPTTTSPTPPPPSLPAPSTAPVASTAPPTASSAPPTTTAPPTTPPPTTTAPVPFVTHFTFTSIAPMPIGTTEANSVVVNGKLYVFGGFDVLAPRQDPTSRAWVYDPATNVWTSLPPMPTHGISHAGIDTDGTRYIYYAGGFIFDTTLQAQLKGNTAVWRYDIQTGLYSAMPPLPQKRASGGLSYIDGKIYYFGGSENYMVTPDHGETWSLDVANGDTTWVPLATMPDPRNHFGWVTINGKIYVAGGQHQEASDSTAQTELDSYNPATNTWTTLAPMPSPRGHMLDSSFVINGRFVVATGWTTTAATAAVTAYDPVTNTWQAMTDVPSARTSATARAVSGGRYVICCGSAGGSTSNGWMANPAP